MIGLSGRGSKIGDVSGVGSHGICLFWRNVAW